MLHQVAACLDEVKSRAHLQPELEASHGLMQACLDPYVNGLHVSLLRKSKNIDLSREYLAQIAGRLIREGPDVLKPVEIKSMMHDTDLVTNLHYRLWSAAEHDLAAFWKMAIQQYNLSSSTPFAHLLAQPTESKSS